jgi:hypothetical protein
VPSLSRTFSTAVAALPTTVALPDGLLRVRLTVSVPSMAVSLATGTVNVLDVSPGAKVRVPLAAV